MTAPAMRRRRLARHPPPQEVRGLVRDENGDRLERSPRHLSNEGLRLVNSNLLHLCRHGLCPPSLAYRNPTPFCLPSCVAPFFAHRAFPSSPNANFAQLWLSPAQNPLSALRRHPPRRMKPFHDNYGVRWWARTRAALDAGPPATCRTSRPPTVEAAAHPAADLLDEIAGQHAVLGDQLLDEQVRVGMGAYGDRGQAEADRPAPRPAGQAFE
jgi:hypothetical protein